MVEIRLRRFGHIERRSANSVVRKVDEIEGSQAARGRGRLKKPIRESIKKDIEIDELDRSMLLIEHSDVDVV